MELTANNIEVYSSSGIGKKRYHIIYTDAKNTFEGDIELAYGVRGDDTYPYVDFIEWEYDVEPENSEEIELYVESNLYELMNEAEHIR